MNRKKLSMIVIAIQVIFFVGWYMAESQAFGKPVATIQVKPEPYDPRDLLSGQYFRLNYAFSRTSDRWDQELKKSITPAWAKDLYCTDIDEQECSTYGPKQTGDVWVSLVKGEDGFHHPIAASFDKPAHTTSGHVVIKGYATKNASNLTFGIEKYFVEEGTKEPPRDDTVIMLDVYESGKVRINTLLVKGKKWP